MAARLLTLKNDEGVNEIMDNTPISTILKALENLYMDVKPLWVQRMEFFRTNQGPNQKFEDWWAQKTIMKENCKLQNGLNSNDLDVQELIRGVHSDDLRCELLKEKEPKPNKLIKIAREFVHWIEMGKNFKAVC